ncbi:MAG: YfcE family phosphodiesterase [Panacagrimonas sp.]|jgi:putative phosphoesterase|nr:metallophosphoesterase family protein [Panacagrimonas sp.]MCC2654976.1 YfcE family phosphodiesterase [Panacagrimonas sp.]
MPSKRREIRVGVLSDTHGLLRPEALAFLRGSDHILHAGDIGGAGILAQLAELAPVTAVRGNNDDEPWAASIAESRRITLGGAVFHLLHDRAQLDLDPDAEGIHVVVSGHSHRPLLERRGGVLYLNPGSAGRRRFRLPVSVAEVRVAADGTVHAHLVELDVGAPRR